jgi:hypothetical protein
MADFNFQGSKRAVKLKILNFIGQLTQSAHHDRAAKSVFNAIGFVALSDIHEDFVTKSRGGTGEDGVRWPPLSPEYLAYHRRFGPGEKAALKRAAGLGKGHSKGVQGKSGLLNSAQQKQWYAVYNRTIAWAAQRFDIAKAHHIAAGHAWNVVKAGGAKTMLEVYGTRQVDILRDTGVLLNSLSPGYFDGEEYTKPTVEGGDQQIFRPIADGIVIGTSVPYAGAHQDGKGVPKRPFLPERVPDSWIQRWANVGIQAVAVALRKYVGVAYCF